MDASAANLEALLAQQAWMQRLARRLVLDEAARDDLVQSAWLDLLKRPPRPGAGLRGFLATLLRRRAAKRKRESTRRERRERGHAPRESSLPSPDELSSEIEAQRNVVAAVLALDESHRDVIILRYFHDLSAHAIARERGLTIAAVESRLRRGLEKLRAELTREVGGDARRWALPLLPVASRATADAAIGIGIGIGAGALLMSKPIVGAAIAATLFVAASFFAESDPRTETSGTPVAAVAPAVADESTIPNTEASDAPEVERTSVALEDASAPRADARTSEVPSSCRLRVVDAFGAPAAHGEIVLEREGTIAPQFPGLDEQGEANLPRSNVATWLWVFFDGSAPVRLPVSLAAESTTVTLPRGEVVAGRVEIDGAPARRPVGIELRALDGFRALETAPAELYDWWSARRFSSVSSLSTTSDAFGRFRFTGLESGRRVVVSGNDRFVTGTDAGSMPLLQVEAPRDDLVLSFVTKPFVSGRAVDANAQPSKHALVTLNVTNRTNGDAGRSQLEADDDGRFAIPFPLAGDTVTVEVRAHDGSYTKRRVEAPFPVEIALGDLVLTAPRTIRFRAIARDGSPISGAEAFLAEDPQNRSAESGTDGAGVFSIPTAIGATDFYVHANGHELGVGAIPADGDTLVEVVLTPSTRLWVRLDPTEGWPSPMVLLASASLPNAPRELAGLAALAATTWGIDHHLEYRDGRLRLMVDFGPSGTIELERLAPSVEWTIEVRYPRRNRLVEQRVTLAPGEESVLVLAPPRPRTLSGRVVDAAGRPIRGAQLTVGWEDVRVGGVGASDGDGRYAVNGIFADSVNVRIRRDGFVSAIREGVPVSETGATLDLTLTEGADPIESTEDR